MPVKNFHTTEDPTAHDNFARWCKEVPKGLFIHHGPGGAMLHRVNCPSMASGTQQEWGDLANHRKVCSPDEQELIDHHHLEHGAPPAKCPDCY